MLIVPPSIWNQGFGWTEKVYRLSRTSKSTQQVTAAHIVLKGVFQIETLKYLNGRRSRWKIFQRLRRKTRYNFHKNSLTASRWGLWSQGTYLTSWRDGFNWQAPYRTWELSWNLMRFPTKKTWTWKWSDEKHPWKNVAVYVEAFPFDG